MKKTVKKQKKPLDLSLLKGVGSGLKEIFIVAATHPTAAAIAVMVTTSTVKMVSGAFQEKTEWQKKLSGELTGLYNGAQTLGAAAALAPIALAGIQAATSIASMRKPPT